MPLPKGVEDARALRQAGNYAAAFQLLAEFLDNLREDQHPERIAALNEQSACLWRGGQLSKAEVHAKEALHLAKEAFVNLQGQGEALNNLGLISWQRGRLDSAEEYFQQSLHLRKQVGNPQDIARTLNNLGIIHYQHGELDRAEEYYQEALALREQIKNPQDIAKSLNNLGLIYWQWGELDRAEEYLQQAFALKEQFGSPQDIAGALNNLGRIYWQRGELDRAEEYHQRALALKEQFSHPQDIALSLYNLGSICEVRGVLDEAEDYYRQAFILFEQLGNPQNIAMSLLNLGTVYEARGELSQAEESYRQGIVLLEEADIFWPMANLIISLIRILLVREALEDVSEPLKRLKRLTQIFPTAEAAGYHSLALGLVKLGYQDLQGALNHGLKAHRLATTIPHFQLQIETLHLIIQVYLGFYINDGQVAHLGQLTTFLEALCQINHRERLYGIKVTVLLIQGRLALLQFHLARAREYFCQAKAQAEILGLRLVSQECEEGLEDLKAASLRDLVRNLGATEKRKFQQQQVNEVLTYLKWLLSQHQIPQEMR